MAAMHPEKLVIAISSRALFDLDEAHRVFEEEGLEAYSRYQIAHEQDPLAPGQAFTMVRKLLDLDGQYEYNLNHVLLKGCTIIKTDNERNIAIVYETGYRTLKG